MTLNPDDPLYQAIFACEVQVWSALVSGDMAADAAALDETFLGVYPDGFAAKADHTGQLAQGPTVSDYAMSQVQVRPMGQDYALISYQATCQRINRPSMTMFVSSIWQRKAAHWVNIFSQDTPA